MRSTSSDNDPLDERVTTHTGLPLLSIDTEPLLLPPLLALWPDKNAVKGGPVMTERLTEHAPDRLVEAEDVRFAQGIGGTLWV